MSKPTRRQLLAFSTLIAGTLLVSGCTSSGGLVGPGASQSALLERSQAYWNAIKNNDRVSAWPLSELSLDPRWTLQDYVKRGGIVYHEAEVLGVQEVDGKNAIVSVRVLYDVPQARMKRQKGVFEDQWHLVDGQWYHAHRRSLALGTPSDDS